MIHDRPRAGGIPVPFALAVAGIVAGTAVAIGSLPSSTHTLAHALTVPSLTAPAPAPVAAIPVATRTVTVTRACDPVNDPEDCSVEDITHMPVGEWLVTPCPQEDSNDCYWNAEARGNGRGVSFYAITVGKRECLIYPRKPSLNVCVRKDY